jgi:hypothetical protein
MNLPLTDHFLGDGSKRWDGFPAKRLYWEDAPNFDER